MITKSKTKVKNTVKVKFFLTAETNFKSVELFGLNNEWTVGLPLKAKKDGTFNLEITLPAEGKHQFKYLINGENWVSDTDADGLIEDGFGGQNSLLHT